MLNPLPVVASTSIAIFFGLGAVGVASAGTVAVAAGLGALALVQRFHNIPWQSIGLGRPAAPGRFTLQVLGGLLAGWCAALLALLLATRGLGLDAPDASRFAGIEGNGLALLGALAISWTTAAFGEEVLFRGLLQSRLQALIGDCRFAAALAAVLQAVLFGLGHAYQGMTGVLVSGAIGLVFGLLMVRFRVVWPLVVAHGLIDTVSMLALFAGAGRG